MSNEMAESSEFESMNNLLMNEVKENLKIISDIESYYIDEH
jgi:hypothetical protein